MATLRPPRSSDDETEEPGSHVMRFGAAVSAVVLAAIIATMPAAVRIVPSLSGTRSGLSVWVALLAVAFLPLAAATVVLRHALAALRLFDSKAVAIGVATALLWGAATFGALVVLGATLRATTHHHALAGVTFSAAGAAAAALLAPCAVRAVKWMWAAPASLRWCAIGIIGAGLAIALALSARVLARSDSASALVVDVAAFALATAFGAGAFPHRSRPFPPLAFAGPPLAAIVLAVGFATVVDSPTLRIALREQAVVLHGVLRPFSCLDATTPAPSH